MPTKRIVCLANSRKLSGRCVAGRELVADRPEAWVRPVSAREHQEVSEHERQYQDSSDPRRVQKYKRTLRPTRRAVAEFIYHYYGELNHQGLGDAFLFLDTTGSGLALPPHDRGF